MQVSIILPAYNAERFIADAIDSVLAQTFGDWELLIVDDGSLDRTATIIERRIDVRIRVIHQTNAGVSSARNAALDAAVGEFVTFMDADDLLPKDALMKRVNYLLANPSVDIVNGSIRVTEQGRTLRVYTPAKTIEPLFPRISVLDESYFFGPFYMLRRAVIGAHRFPVGLSHCEDLCFFLELADSEDLTYGAVDAEVYVYRKHGGSAMTSLAGIEAGYLALLGRATRLRQMTPSHIRRLRLRIASIMAKSWLREVRPLRAMHAVLRVWNAAR